MTWRLVDCRDAARARGRLALFVLVGVFLIPIVLSSLSGLTHVLTCTQPLQAPFTLELPTNGPPTLLSATTVTRGKPGPCAGLALDMGVTTLGPNRVRVLLPITNHTRYTWEGSVKLVLGHTSVPLTIGAVRPGATRTAHVDVHVDPGTHEVGGSLLLGP